MKHLYIAYTNIDFKLRPEWMPQIHYRNDLHSSRDVYFWSYVKLILGQILYYTDTWHYTTWCDAWKYLRNIRKFRYYHWSIDDQSLFQNAKEPPQNELLIADEQFFQVWWWNTIVCVAMDETDLEEGVRGCIDGERGIGGNGTMAVTVYVTFTSFTARVQFISHHIRCNWSSKGSRPSWAKSSQTERTSTPPPLLALVQFSSFPHPQLNQLVSEPRYLTPRVISVLLFINFSPTTFHIRAFYERRLIALTKARQL